MFLLIFIFILFLPSEVQADPVSAVVAAVVAKVSAITVSSFIASALISTTVSFVIGQVSSLIAGKPSSSRGGASAQRTRTSGSTQQFRQAVSSRQFIYGEQRISGPIIYSGVTDDNKYLHMVIALASHECEEIGEMMIGDESIPTDYLDSDGTVNTGRYSGFIRVKKHLGTDSQTADSDLVSEVSEWTVNHRLRGVAYVYVRLVWDRDVFTSGVPNFSFWVKGKKTLDTRDSTTRWSPNVGLCANDFLTDTFYGLSASSVDDDELQSTVNTCDEIVTTANIDVSLSEIETDTDCLVFNGEERLPFQLGDRVTPTSFFTSELTVGVSYYAIPFQRKDKPRMRLATSLQNAIEGVYINFTSSSTGVIRKTGEPRYHGGGLLDMGETKGQNLLRILSGMGGRAIESNGVWKILAAEYRLPTVSYNESDLIDTITVSTRLPNTDRCNQIQGVFLTPLNDGNPADYPLVKNSTYETEDGEEIKKNVDFLFTPRTHTAQRLAKFLLERNRQEIKFTAKFKLTAFKSQVGDNIYFSFTRYGWSSKIFEVLEWSLSSDNGTPYIEMTLQENASSVYDWNSGEETRFDPAPNTSLPEVTNPAPPTGLSVTPVEIRTAANDLTYEFKIDFTPSIDAYVTNGGYYETQYKESNDDSFENFIRVEDNQSTVRIKQVNPGVSYDFQIRSVNYLGSRSTWQELYGFTVSSPSGATIRIDDGQITGAVIQSENQGSITTAVTNTVDEGTII